MSGTDPFLHYDAAYAFGTLDADDRVAFEAHLTGCVACRERVADAHGTARLLAAVGSMPPADAAADAPPDLLLPALLRAAGRERRRRRLLTGGLIGVAAASVVALVVSLWPSAEPQPQQPPRRQFVAVQAAPVEASALLVSRQWGTEINLQCRYTRELQQGRTYRLVVIDTAQRRYDAGGWTLGAQTTEFTGGTQVAKADIAEVQITLADGRPILQLTP